MDATLAVKQPKTARGEGLSRPAAGWGALVCGGLLASFALLILARRAAGALSEPAAPATLLATGTALAMLAAAIRGLGRYALAAGTNHRMDQAVLAGPTVLVMLAAAGLTLPNTSLLGVALLWAPLVAEEVWAWRHGWPARESTGVIDQAGLAPRGLDRWGRDRWGRDQTALAAPDAAHVSQRVVRGTKAGGAEFLWAWIRAELAPGQRTANVHIAFCPPFEKTPTVAHRQLEGPPARAKTGQLLPHGVRLDLKLGAPAVEGTELVFEIEAAEEQSS